MALFAAVELASNEEYSDLRACCHFLSAGTDGQDGPTDAAGAVVSGTTVANNLDAARKSLAQCDSYSFWSSCCPAALIKTGLTGTNVMDLQVVLVVKGV